MLRMNPTQIRLEARDLTWHINRHDERQALRAHAVRPVDMTNKSPRSNKVLQSNSGAVSPTRHATIQNVRTNDDSEMALVSKDPVPRGSRTFWDKILADAGTPTRTRSTFARNGKLFQPSDDWLENNRSTRVSFEDSETENARHAEHDGRLNKDFDPQSSTVEDQEHSSAPSISPESFHSADSVRLEACAEPGHTLSEEIDPLSARSRLSSFFHRKSRQDKSEGSQPSQTPHDTNQGNFDGPSDATKEQLCARPDSSGTDSGPDINDHLYGSRRDRRTISTSLETYDGEGGEMDLPLPGPPTLELPSRSASPTLPVSGQVDFLRRRSGALPRSPLYIAQAAQSSSPEKRPTDASDFNGARPPETPGLLVQPQRRRHMTYRHRSESYSFVASEDSSMPIVPILYGPSSISSTLQERLLLSVPFYSQHNVFTTSTEPAAGAPPISASPSDLQSPAPEAPRNYSNDSSTSHRSIHNNFLASSPPESAFPITYSPLTTLHNPFDTSSPQPSAYTPSHRSISSTRPSPLPLPPPFSATRRNTSLNLSLPSNPPSITPSTPHTPPSIPLTPSSQRQSSAPIGLTSITPHTPQTPSFTIHEDSPSPPHLRVYNDAQPPSTQPQTPADLTRTGRRYATRNPFNTAPPRVPTAALPRGRVVTPTRASGVRRRWEANAAAENAGSVTPEERAWRRTRAAGVGMGREERERERGRG